MLFHVKPLEKARERLFQRDLDDHRGVRGFLVRVLRLLVLGYREFRLDFCWERGATLAFSTLLSLLPIAVLVMNVLSLPQIEDNLKDWAKGIFVRALPADLRSEPAPSDDTEAEPGGESDPATDPATDPESDPATDPATDPGVATETDPATEADPPPAAKRSELYDEIRDFIDRNLTADKLRIDGGANVLAIIGLLVAGLALLVSAERVFSAIWKASSNRSYLQKFVVFWAILSLSPLLLGISFYAISLGGTVEVGVEASGGGEPSWLITTVYSFVIPVLVSSLAFTLMNLFLPPVRVRIVPALVGGFASGVLWETLKSGFGVYVDRARELESVYHSLTMVPVFLVFVYTSWLAILVGTELSYSLQNYKRLIREFRHRTHSEETGRYSAVFLGIFFLSRVIRAYRAGGAPIRVEDVADVLGVYVEELNPVIERLTEHGVILESAREPGRFVPAADPSTVRLEDVVRFLLVRSNREEAEFFAAIDETASEVGTDGERDALRREIGEDLVRSRGAFLEAFAGRVLSDLQGADRAEGGEIRASVGEISVTMPSSPSEHGDLLEADEPPRTEAEVKAKAEPNAAPGSGPRIP